MERKMGRKKWCYPAISLGLAVLGAAVLLFAVQQWLSPFLFFGATFVMMLLFLANSASGVTFYVLKKEKAWLTAAFLCWNAAGFFLALYSFSVQAMVLL